MKFYARQRRMPTVIIVSLIDIFAILLIFVIVTTTFKRVQPEVVINLPEAATAAAVDERTEAAVLTVKNEGEIFLENQRLTMEELLPAVQAVLAQNPGRAFALNADRQAPFGTIVRILDVLKSAGVKNIPAFMEAPQG